MEQMEDVMLEKASNVTEDGFKDDDAAHEEVTDGSNVTSDDEAHEEATDGFDVTTDDAPTETAPVELPKLCFASEQQEDVVYETSDPISDVELEQAEIRRGQSLISTGYEEAFDCTPEILYKEKWPTRGKMCLSTIRSFFHHTGLKIS